MPSRCLAGWILWTCFLYKVSCDFGWPKGTYGLPEPVSGCPNFNGLQWQRGYTYHNTEDEDPANKRSKMYHFAGDYSQRGIQQRFCIKETPSGSDEGWPDGKYCIYKKGDCPSGLTTGFIKWDDDHHALDVANKREGITPDGEFGKPHTTLHYCCNGKGDLDTPIKLPNLKPFYLLAFQSPKCQQVEGTTSSVEFIKFDDNDRGSTSSFGGDHPYGPAEDLFNTKVYYCYYKPIPKPAPAVTSSTNEGIGLKVDAKANKSSGVGLAVGCGVAGALVGIVALGFVIRRMRANKMAQGAGACPDAAADLLN